LPRNLEVHFDAVKLILFFIVMGILFIAGMMASAMLYVEFLRIIAKLLDFLIGNVDTNQLRQKLSSLIDKDGDVNDIQVDLLVKDLTSLM